MQNSKRAIGPRRQVTGSRSLGMGEPDPGLPTAARLAEQVTFAITNFNGEADLGPTLEALVGLHGDCRIVVVDDGSTDGSCDLVRQRFPDVELIALPRNEGLPLIRKRAVEECATPYLMLMDNDVTFAPDCVARLLQQLLDYPNALSCRPRLVYADRPQVIYQDASTMHYVALAADQRRGRPVSEGLEPFPRQTIGGGIMLLNCAIARELGNFDERYLFGWSDNELDMRARLCGYLTLQDPHALGLHVERIGGLRRVLGQLYNRRRFILICYSARTLLVIAPALLLFEIVLLAMCLASGYGKQYLLAWKQLAVDFGDIRRRRRELQARRSCGDGVVLSGGEISITGRMASSRWLKWLSPALSGLYGAYWRLARLLIADVDRSPFDGTNPISISGQSPGRGSRVHVRGA